MRFASSAAERAQEAMYEARYNELKPKESLHSGKINKVGVQLRERQPEKELAGKFRFKARHSVERTIDYIRDRNRS